MPTTQKPFIPGLVHDVYIKGSRHSAPTPVLKKADVNEYSGEVNFEWKAYGTRTYKVIAKGKLEWEKKYKGLEVECSCPDADRQAYNRLQSDTDNFFVCKHAAAALDDVIDTIVDEEEQLQQEMEFVPGREHDRIEYALRNMSACDIVDILKEKIKNVEGLKAVAAVLTSDVAPYEFGSEDDY